MKIRVLIVDDEPLARERLRSLLEKEADIEIVGECGDGVEAVEAIREKRPDLVFLDVQMPELDGFGVLEQLQGSPMPAIVFVTAYDQFAVQAFEVHALDYLLKPFDRERLKVALDRARQRLQAQPPTDTAEPVHRLLQDLQQRLQRPRRLAVKSGGKVLLIRLDEIDWIEAADNYVNIHYGPNSVMHRETMTALEKALPSDKFARISRSCIVNLDKIKELQPMFHGDYAVILHNGTRLTLSRNYRDKLDALLGKD